MPYSYFRHAYKVQSHFVCHDLYNISFHLSEQSFIAIFEKNVITQIYYNGTRLEKYRFWLFQN